MGALLASCRFSLKKGARRPFHRDVFHHAIDRVDGLMVAFHVRGGTESRYAEQVSSALAALGSAAVPVGRPKVYLLHIAPDAPSPDALQREQIAAAWRRTSALNVLFAVVTTSTVARASLHVVGHLRGLCDTRWGRAFDECEEALAWIESSRPGVRGTLLRLQEDAAVVVSSEPRRAADQHCAMLR